MGLAGGWSSLDVWPSATATSCARRFRKSMPCSGPARCPRSSTRLAAWRRQELRRLRSIAGPRTLHPAPCTLHPAPDYIYDAETPRHLATPGHYAYVKVAEGCDYKCAFCIIPTLRGHYRSRPADSIVREAHALAARGVKELLLISQDTTFCGIDRQERGALARLLRALERVDGIEWIRL